SQLGLIFNGLLKVPMQFFILLVGVMVFIFYQYNPSPLNFNPYANKAVMESEYADEYRALEQEHKALEEEKRMANEKFSGVIGVKDYDVLISAQNKIQS